MRNKEPDEDDSKVTLSNNTHPQKNHISTEIPVLSSIYTLRHKGPIYACMLPCIGPLLYSAYTINGAIINPTVFHGGTLPDVLVLTPILILLGLGLTRNEVGDRIDAVITYSRVSTRDQEHGTSLEDQKATLEKERTKLDVNENLIIGDHWESASTMHRETIDEIISKVEESERTYCLMLRGIDRLTRADPLESCVFLWVMRQNDVLLYIDDMGYFDLSNIMEQMMLFFELFQARKEYERITQNREDANRKMLGNDKWPGRPPYGFKKDGNDKLKTTKKEPEVIRRAVGLVLNGDDEHGVPAGNMKRAHLRLLEEFDEDVAPSYQQLRRFLRSPKYTGKLIVDGEVVGECPEIIPQDQFTELQDVLDDREYEKDEGELDHELKSVISKFGVETSLKMFEDIIKGKCPECAGDVRPHGSEERFGHQIKRYRCVNHPDFVKEEEDDTVDEEEETDEHVCDFEGPLLSGEFVRDWQSAVPLTCPACQHPLDDDTWVDTHTKLGAIEQTCERCELTTTVTVADNKFERAQEIPEKIDFFEEQSEKISSNENGEQIETSDTDTSSRNHRLLSEFEE